MGMTEPANSEARTVPGTWALPGPSDHKLSLAEELLKEIELSEQPLQTSLLKAYRLARLMANAEMERRLRLELYGYPREREYDNLMIVMGRLYNRSDRMYNYYQPLGQIEAMLHAEQDRLRALRVPDISWSSADPNAVTSVLYNPITQALDKVGLDMKATVGRIGQLSGIVARVIAQLHAYASTVYHNLRFSGLQDTFFENHRRLIDARLSDKCSDILNKVPAVYQRLVEGDAEAISQALNTCRRMIDSFADEIYPPTEGTAMVDGVALKVGPQHHQNRICAYIAAHCDSKTRRKRLRDLMTNLYDRVCAGVHADITAEEARFLFIETYLFLGEVLSLEQQQDAQRAASSA
jgi:hypothetical protein